MVDSTPTDDTKKLAPIADQQASNRPSHPADPRPRLCRARWYQRCARVRLVPTWSQRGKGLRWAIQRPLENNFACALEPAKLRRVPST